jgi:hypothetical protein
MMITRWQSLASRYADFSATPHTAIDATVASFDAGPVIPIERLTIAAFKELVFLEKGHCVSPMPEVR